MNHAKTENSVPLRKSNTQLKNPVNEQRNPCTQLRADVEKKGAGTTWLENHPGSVIGVRVTKKKSEANSKNRALQHDRYSDDGMLFEGGCLSVQESTLSRNSIARRRSEASGGVSCSGLGRARKRRGSEFFSLSDLLDKSMPAGGRGGSGRSDEGRRRGGGGRVWREEERWFLGGVGDERLERG